MLWFLSTLRFTDLEVKTWRQKEMCSVNVTSMLQIGVLCFVRSIVKYIFIEKRWQENEY